MQRECILIWKHLGKKKFCGCITMQLPYNLCRFLASFQAAFTSGGAEELNPILLFLSRLRLHIQHVVMGDPDSQGCLVNAELMHCFQSPWLASFRLARQWYFPSSSVSDRCICQGWFNTAWTSSMCAWLWVWKPTAGRVGKGAGRCV